MNDWRKYDVHCVLNNKRHSLDENNKCHVCGYQKPDGCEHLWISKNEIVNGKCKTWCKKCGEINYV